MSLLQYFSEAKIDVDKKNSTVLLDSYGAITYVVFKCYLNATPTVCRYVYMYATTQINAFKNDGSMVGLKHVELK